MIKRLISSGAWNRLKEESFHGVPWGSLDYIYVPRMWYTGEVKDKKLTLISMRKLMILFPTIKSAQGSIIWIGVRETFNIEPQVPSLGISLALKLALTFPEVPLTCAAGFRRFMMGHFLLGTISFKVSWLFTMTENFGFVIRWQHVPMFLLFYLLDFFLLIVKDLCSLSEMIVQL